MPTATIIEFLPYFILFLILTFILCRPFVKREPIEYSIFAGGDEWEALMFGRILQVFRLRPAWSVITMMNGKTSETDFAFATKAGIFAVECKFRDSSVYGTYDGYKWECGSGEELYSPIFQNRTHIESIRSYLTDITKRDHIDIPGPSPMEVPVYNIIAIRTQGQPVMFDFKKIKRDHWYRKKGHPDIIVINSGGAVRKLKLLPKVMSGEAADWYNAQLRVLQATKEEFKEHTEEVQKEQERYKKS